MLAVPVRVEFSETITWFVSLKLNTVKFVWTAYIFLSHFHVIIPLFQHCICFYDSAFNTVNEIMVLGLSRLLSHWIKSFQELKAAAITLNFMSLKWRTNQIFDLIKWCSKRRFRPNCSLTSNLVSRGLWYLKIFFSVSRKNFEYLFLKMLKLSEFWIF